MRIGIGYDVHKLVFERDLIIGGVNIPFAKGLLGHSDADVLTHALMDALLGAAGMPDMGNLFPDTDHAYKDANSIELLKVVMNELDKAGYKIVNVDSVIIAEKPKIAPYVDEMIGNLAAAMNVPKDLVCVKATTTEGLDSMGAGMGMAAQAVVLIEKK